MRSIRGYLLSRLLAGAAALLLVAGALLYWLVTRALEAQFDRNLEERIQAFASILFQDGEHLEFEFSDELMPEYDPGPEAAYFELRHEDGRVLERSNSLGRRDLAAPAPPGPVPALWTAELPDGRQGRFASQRVEVHHVYPEEGPNRPRAERIGVVVARGCEELIAARRRALAFGALFILTLLGLLAFLTRLAVDRGLRPARRLARTLDALRMDQLPDHVDVGALPAELEPVARRVDALVARVDAALRRERRTAADIAHELRTPISELVTVSEVALRNGHAPGEGEREALATIRDVAWRMGRSVSTLLKLARLEAGDESFQPGPVELGELVRETLASLGRVGGGRGLAVENEVPADAVVEGDAEVLRIVVANLFANALAYAAPGGRVACRLEAGTGIGTGSAAWRLVVENETDELSPADLGQLDEPFWRKDGARADRERVGLGLALSGALARRAGLGLAFALEGRTFRASLGPAPGGLPAPGARR